MSGAYGHRPMSHSFPFPTVAVRFAKIFVLLLLLAGCGRTNKEQPAGAEPAAKPAKPDVITFGAYTTPREAYGKSILPTFRKKWQAQSGRDVEFRESYLGSGAQARAIVAGFEADVAALSLEPDLEKLEKAKLIEHDWKSGEYQGMVTRSVVVIGVREGNPKNIKTWEDLARPGVEVLTPNVRTSGGAMWNVLAIYGAALRGHAGVPAGDKEGAIKLLASILRNVKIMDRGARDSMLTFERGVGDAIITYENEILVGRKEGKRYDYITPSSTVLIENPIALLDVHAKRHGASEVSRAFIDFLFTPEAQRAFAEFGLRPVNKTVAAETSARFAPVSDLFTIRDVGGWDEVQKGVFGENGAYDQAVLGSKKETP